MKTKQKVVFVGAVILLLASGFIRDFFMLNVNHVLYHLTKGYDNYAQPPFHFLAAWSVKDIMVLKWVLTVVFFGYFWGISWFTLKTYFGPKGRPVKAISYVFIALIAVAGFFFVTGYIFGIQKSMYHVVRTLTGLTHSFIPAMLVFLYIKYFPEGSEVADNK